MLLISVKLLAKYVIIIYVRRLNRSRFKGEIPGRTRREERLSRSKLKEASLFDLDVERFMNKVRLMKSSASLTRSYSSSHYFSCEKGKKGCFIKKIGREKERCLKFIS